MLARWLTRAVDVSLPSARNEVPVRTITRCGVTAARARNVAAPVAANGPAFVGAGSVPVGVASPFDELGAVRLAAGAPGLGTLARVVTFVTRSRTKMSVVPFVSLATRFVASD